MQPNYFLLVAELFLGAFLGVAFCSDPVLLASPLPLGILERDILERFGLGFALEAAALDFLTVVFEVFLDSVESRRFAISLLKKINCLPRPL